MCFLPSWGITLDQDFPRWLPRASSCLGLPRPYLRTVEVGRGLWSSSGPTSLLKRGYLEQAAQDHVQLAFDYLQGWRLHNFSGNLSQRLVTLTVKKCLLMFKQNVLCFSLCPLPPVPSLATTAKSLAPSSLHPSFRLDQRQENNRQVNTSTPQTIKQGESTPRTRQKQNEHMHRRRRQCDGRLYRQLSCERQ